MNRIGSGLFLVALFAGGTASCNPADATKDIPAGRWMVHHVHIDKMSTRSTSYMHDDPRLVGRIFSFSKSEIENDSAELSACHMPRIRELNKSLAWTLAQSMGSRLTGQSAPAPDDFGIDNISGSPVLIMCNGNTWNEDLGSNLAGTWMARTNDNSIYLRWYDETIIELRPAPRRINPSFKCDRVLSSTEQKICSSMSLSSLDLSLSRMYAWRRKLILDSGADKDSIRNFLSGQRKWLEARESCGFDASCIRVSIMDRMDALRSE